jgi:intracellular sulfur oxidation DsrE/DsrF family protein
MFAQIAVALAVSHAQVAPIKIDVPVHLKKADAVFNVLHIEPTSPDRQTSLFLMKTFAGVLAGRKTPSRIVAIFHSGAAALACNDEAFNRLTGTTSGNPYKADIAGLQKQGIQTEICVKSMQFQHIQRSELLPGIKVNGGALLRVIELTQKGYTQFSF